MKRIFSIVLTVVFLASALHSTAQRQGKFFSVGFGLEAGKPLDAAANAYNFTGGLTVRFSLHAGPGFATISTGGVLFVPWQIGNQGTKVAAQIPIEGGYKYIFMKHFFVMGELGYSLFRYYSEGSNTTLVTYKTGGFSYGPSAGVQFGVIEIRVKYETIQLNTNNLSDINLRLGFNF